MSNQPTHRLVFASEKGPNGKREYIDLASLWIGGEYDSGKLAAPYKERAGIAAIKLTDGRVIDPSKFKLYVNRNESRSTVQRNEPDFGSADDTDLPF